MAKFLGFQLWLHQATMAWQKGKLRVLLSQWKAETVESTLRKLGEKTINKGTTVTTTHNNQQQTTANNKQPTNNRQPTNKQQTNNKQATKNQQTTNSKQPTAAQHHNQQALASTAKKCDLRCDFHIIQDW